MKMVSILLRASLPSPPPPKHTCAHIVKYHFITLMAYYRPFRAFIIHCFESILTHHKRIFCSIFLAVINWLNKQMNEQMLGRAPLTAPVGFPPRISAQPQGVLSSSAGHALSSIRPSPSGVILQSQRHSLPLPTTAAGTQVGLLGVPRPQLQHRVSE
jgi:hypothetical protein